MKSRFSIRRRRGQLRQRTALGAVVALTLLAATAVMTSPVGAASSAYVPHTALINGGTVSTDEGIVDDQGDPISLEQYAAQRQGFTVTTVSASTWASMSAADFAQYQLLIIGDNYDLGDCFDTPSPLDNASTWAPVVMGTSGLHDEVGNRALVGTDPADHFQNGGGGASEAVPGDPSSAGAEHLVESAISYAGSVSGATGIYYSPSCGEDDVAALNQLSTTGTGFTSNTDPPCGGSVALIAANPSFASLTDADIQGWSCSDHITRPTYPTDWQPLAVATDTDTHPTCGTDPIDGTTQCGEAYVLLAGQNIDVTAPDLSFDFPDSSSAAGGSLTLTVTVTRPDGTAAPGLRVSLASTPDSGVPVGFEVTGQNAGVTGTCAPASCETDSNGQVSFTYDDVNGPGVDTINASITVNSTTEHATASHTWTVAGNSPPTVEAGPAVSGQVGVPIQLNGSVSDPDADPVTINWTGPVGCTFADPHSAATSITCAMPGTFEVDLTANDGVNPEVTDTTQVRVSMPTGGRGACDGVAPTAGVTETTDPSTGVTTITGTDGNDVIVATPGPDVVKGGKGNDVICGAAGNDQVFGGPGDDTLFGQGGDDRVYGGRGNDFVVGNAGRDLVKGQAGDDSVYGDDGNDNNQGGAGDDEVHGGPGNDHLSGGSGANRLIGGSGQDVCNSAPGGSDVDKSCEIKNRS